MENGLPGYCQSAPLYIEPFAGMLGVLLQKPKSKCEIVNDLDGLIYSFWKCIRDHPKEFHYQMNNMPQCRRTFMDAVETRKNYLNGTDISILEIACAVSMILLHGYSGKLSEDTFIIRQETPNQTQQFTKRLQRLHERLIDVRVENMDVLKLLDKYKEKDDATIYCDPPYPGSVKRGMDYNQKLSSIADFCDMAKAQKGKIAISGYGNDFDQLDWYKSEMKGLMTVSNNAGEKSRDRIEVLWTNYKPEKQMTLLDL